MSKRNWQIDCLDIDISEALEFLKKSTIALKHSLRDGNRQAVKGGSL